VRVGLRLHLPVLIDRPRGDDDAGVRKRLASLGRVLPHGQTTLAGRRLRGQDDTVMRVEVCFRIVGGAVVAAPALGGVCRSGGGPQGRRYRVAVNNDVR
jgi:hypothetical protein